MAKKALLIIIGLCLTISSGMVVSTPAFSQPIELTVNDHNPPPSTVAQAWDAWGKWVEERSKGRLKVTIHHGGALLAEKEAYRGTETGVCDMAHYVVDRREGFLLSTVTTLPFLGMPAQMEAGQLWMELLNKFPEMAKEWEGVKIIGIFMMPPTHIHTKKKAVETPADLKGMKIHGAEYALVQTMDAAGASPVQLDITEMYTGLERGILDGVMNHFPVCFIFKVLELTQYHTVFGDGGINMTPMFAIMNPKKFNSLPPDLQKIMEESGKVWTEEQKKLDFPLQDTAVGFCKGKNHTFTNLTPQGIKVWYDLVKKPIHDKWIADAEAKGLPGKAVYEEALKLITEYQKK
ncbi:MAG: TRAP transporter substrate-binding protein [Deltaproteobacteria bacterium]|nr:MAG: TRAP transporter substrate-binding protein [Deltaproteobacteria bacterium]